MEPQNLTSRYQILAKFGLIYALMLIAVNLLLFITGTTLKLGWLQTVVMLLALLGSLYFGLVSVRDHVKDGYLTYGEGVGNALLIGALGGIIMVVYQFIFMHWINPDFMEQMVNAVTKKMMEEGKSQEEIDTVMHWMGKMNNPYWVSLSTFFSHVLYALVASLPVAYFTKKENPDQSYQSLN